jgi:hypothetical protein
VTPGGYFKLIEIVMEILLFLSLSFSILNLPGDEILSSPLLFVPNSEPED